MRSESRMHKNRKIGVACRPHLSLWCQDRVLVPGKMAGCPRHPTHPDKCMLYNSVEFIGEVFQWPSQPFSTVADVPATSLCSQRNALCKSSHPITASTSTLCTALNACIQLAIPCRMLSPVQFKTKDAQSHDFILKESLQ
jgi:hypothetical protein